MIEAIVTSAVLAVIVILLLIQTFYIVQQQTAYVIERLGRFNVVTHSGFHAKIPFIDRIAGKLSLKVIQLDNHFNTKTRDNVFVTVHVPVQYKVDPNAVQVAFYELQNPEQQIRAYIEDVLRTSICELDLDETYNNKDQIAQQMFDSISVKMRDFGFIIVNVLVTAVDPDERIREAMNSINEAERLKVATKERMEAQRIEIEVAAEAEAKAARLKGTGIADQRTEIVKGLAESVSQLSETGLDSQEIMAVLVTNEYLSVLESFARNNGSNTIFLPAGTDGAGDMQTQIMAALEGVKRRRPQA